jgi:hypothetical protein
MRIKFEAKVDETSEMGRSMAICNFRRSKEDEKENG